MVQEFELIPGVGFLPLRLGMTQEGVIRLLGEPAKKDYTCDDDIETDVEFSYPKLQLDLSFYEMDDHKLSWMEIGSGTKVMWESVNIFELSKEVLLNRFRAIGGEPEIDELREDPTSPPVEISYNYEKIGVCLYFDENGNLESIGV